MTRLYLFAEGQTEQTFADTVLKPHLANFGVYLHRPVLVATSRKRGKVYRGGGRHYLPMRNDVDRFLKQEAGTDVFFTTMIDLYAISSDFPRLDEAESLRHDPQRRVELLETAFADDVGDTRFIPFLQLHEYETYLFVDAAGFGCFYEDAEKQIANLQTIADAFPTPELINDGPHTAPSKRIIAEFPDYGDAKPTVGPQVAASIGLAAIRAKCPHFNAWLTRLEALDE
ncbi:MAG: DUF4276 family protein [Singulisphaera sp.]